MYDGDFAPIGDVAFRARPRELFASARDLRNLAVQCHNAGEDEHAEYLQANARWYVAMGMTISEIALLPECLAKIPHGKDAW